MGFNMRKRTASEAGFVCTLAEVEAPPLPAKPCAVDVWEQLAQGMSDAIRCRYEGFRVDTPRVGDGSITPLHPP